MADFFQFVMAQPAPYAFGLVCLWLMARQNTENLKERAAWLTVAINLVKEHTEKNEKVAHELHSLRGAITALTLRVEQVLFGGRHAAS